MGERKTPSLFGRHIKKGLRHDLPSLKSEDLPAYRPFYVDFSMLEQIHNNSNQLIVGRRGTGKTHLLGAFNEFIRDESPNELSVMVSILEAVPITPPSQETESHEFSRKRLATAMFEGFLRAFFDRLLEQADKRVKSLVAVRADAKTVFEDANSTLQQLLEAIELGKSYPVKRSTRELRSLETSDAKDTGRSLEVRVRGLAPTIGAHVAANKERNAKSTHEQHTDIEGLLSIDLYAIRILILRLLTCLKIEVLYILIDEWMELDKRTPSDIQPLFAQYLKTTFFNTGRIAVKIASVWHQTTLYDKDALDRSKGIQLKHDIVRSFDLDTAFITSHDEARLFCKTLLFKRLSYVCHELKALATAKGEIDEVFVTELFDNETNFKSFITASHGLPRDLMHIFQKCSVRIRRDFERQCISHDLIFEVARNTYSADKRKNIDPSSSAQRLLKLINSYMERTGRRLFLVENEKAIRSMPLRKLVDEELLHQVPSSVTPRSIQDSHKAYLIDFGNFVDWITAKRKDLSALLNESVLPQFPEDFDEYWEEFVVDVDEIEESRVRCPECKKNISQGHPVFVRARLCPSCASPVAVRGG